MVFTYNNDVVVGCGRDGSTNYYDAWLYKPWNDTWMAMPDYPGATAMAGSSFSIGNRSFGGLGWDLATGFSHSDLWELVKPDHVSIDGPNDEVITTTIYPNPVLQGGMIEFRTSLQGKGSLRIFNDLGALLIDIAPISTGRTISTTDLAPGTYMAEWNMEDKMGVLVFVVHR